MLMPKDEIIADIEAQIRKGGSDYHAWCVGTAKDTHGTVFTRHDMEDLENGWIYREAFTPGAAHEVLDHFVTHCGTDSDAGGGDDGGRFVFAYKKTTPSELLDSLPFRRFAA